MRRALVSEKVNTNLVEAEGETGTESVALI